MCKIVNCKNRSPICDYQFVLTCSDIENNRDSRVMRLDNALLILNWTDKEIKNNGNMDGGR